MGKVLFLLFVAIYANSLAAVVKYRDCGSHEGKALQVSVSPCREQPCILIKDTNTTIDIIFTTSKDIKTVIVKLNGVIGGIPLPFPIPDPHACTNPTSQLKCPLKAGIKQHFHLQMPVKEEYPSLKLEAELYLMDEKENTIICVEIPLQIK